MIVVLSYDSYEQGTEYVIDWLVYLKANFVKVSVKNIFELGSEFTLDITEKKLLHYNIDITKSINVFFYRRIFERFKLKDADSIFKEQLEREVTNEIFDLINYMFFLFRNKEWLPRPNSVIVNKLTMLNKAQEAGLSVPKSKIINTKRNLLTFLNSCKEGIITKPISKSSYFILNRQTYFANVNCIDKSNIETLPEVFFPSLFQERIDRDYEIRVFYLDGKFFSLASLMNNSEEEELVDIKLNTKQGSNHWVTYKLPLEVEYKIDKFMKNNNLNTGSLDIVKSKKGKYIFLEVNPVGQYGHASYYGNFNLEKLIAEWLIKKDKHGS